MACQSSNEKVVVRMPIRLCSDRMLHNSEMSSMHREVADVYWERCCAHRYGLPNVGIQSTYYYIKWCIGGRIEIGQAVEFPLLL